MEVPLGQHMVHTHNEYLIGDKELTNWGYRFICFLQHYIEISLGGGPSGSAHGSHS